MEWTAHSSSAPQALRGTALRRALRRARAEGLDSTPSEHPPETLRLVACIGATPAAAAAFPEPVELPESTGPRALRPDELAVWLETHR
jgi:hypothetical protein